MELFPPVKLGHASGAAPVVPFNPNRYIEFPLVWDYAGDDDRLASTILTLSMAWSKAPNAALSGGSSR
jgi:hypothetical protein